MPAAIPGAAPRGGLVTIKAQIKITGSAKLDRNQSSGQRGLIREGEAFESFCA